MPFITAVFPSGLILAAIPYALLTAASLLLQEDGAAASKRHQDFAMHCQAPPETRQHATHTHSSMMLMPCNQLGVMLTVLCCDMPGIEKLYYIVQLSVMARYA